MQTTQASSIPASSSLSNAKPLRTLFAGHTSKRAREEPDSEAEDMAVEPPAHPAGFSGAGFSGGVGAPASAAAAGTGSNNGAAKGAARKQARQQDAAAAAADSMQDAGEAGEAADGALPPPQRGDCIVFVSPCPSKVTQNET
jgi:hypothetical protein